MLSEQERWQLIQQHTPMLREVCKRTLSKLNCNTMLIEDLLADVQCQCFYWLSGFDGSINVDPANLLYISSKLMTHRTVLRWIEFEELSESLENMTENNEPYYKIGQDADLEVLSMIEKLPARQQLIARAILFEGKTIREVAQQLGITHDPAHKQWKKIVQTLRVMLETTRETEEHE